MKKSTLISAMLLAAVCAPQVGSAQAEIPSATTDLYDFAPWGVGEGMLDLFVAATDKGEKFPTKAELEAAGYYMELEFARSHDRFRPILTQTTETNLVSDVFPTRRIWMNIPTGFPKEIGGYPNGTFDSDVYSMWNYTHMYGAWNHTFYQVPGVWTSAAHKNGTYMMSGIHFYDTTGGDASSGQAYNKFCNTMNTKNADGSYTYADAMLYANRYMGTDGLQINYEGGSPSRLSDFWAAVFARAEELGIDNFHNGIYCSTQVLSSSSANYLYGKKVNGKFNKIGDAFLNYSGGDFYYGGVSTSLSTAKSLSGNADDVYQGVWIVGFDRAWPAMNTNATKEMNMCLWGEHDQSRFFQYRVGTSPMNIQENYQLELDKVMSGGNRHPLNRPALKQSGNAFSASTADAQLRYWGGLAAMAPERSALKQDLPFQTFFCLGNGDVYFYKGKKTLGAWYNMGQQDILPTYRWLVTPKGQNTTAADDIDVRFTHEDAYIGGSSIRVSGATASTGNDIVLYRSELTAKASDITVTMAAKKRAGDVASKMKLILKKQGATDWVEVPFGDLTSVGTWCQKTMNVSGIASGDVIEKIGLRFEGTSDDYQIWVGQIKIDDGAAKRPVAPIEESSLVADVKQENQETMSVRMKWAVNDAGYNCPDKETCDMVFNDEVNVDHFEYFVKFGENGKAAEVGRTSTWATVIPNIPVPADAEQLYVGVRSASVDLKSYSPIVWLPVERYSDLSQLPAVKDDPYETCVLDKYSAGALTAIQTRYLNKLTSTGATQNVNFTRSGPLTDVNPKDSTNYVYADDATFVVTQGETVTFTAVANNSSDGLQYCCLKGYMDWDLDHIFDATNDEYVWERGNGGAGNDAYTSTAERDRIKTGVTFTVKVPEDAAVGMSRFRITASDSWMAHPGPTGLTNKGYTLDIPMEVRGTNEGRKPAPTYRDFRDAGEAEEPETSGIEDIVLPGEGDATMGLYPAVVKDVLNFTDVEKAWIYNVNGRLAKFVQDATETVNVSDLAAGVYVVKMLRGQVVRTAKFVKE